MRNLLRLGLIMLLATLGGATFAPVALAGGPTSVLITSPANQRTSSAYTGDARYQRLASAVGIDTGAGIEQPTSGESPPGEIDSNMGADVRLTWLIHDMAVWRVDRIHLSDDVIWIHTAQPLGDQTGEPGPGIWHRATDPAALRAALAETGVLRKPATADPPSESAPATTPADQAAVPGGAEPPVGLIGLACAALGLALGVAATLLTLRLRRHPTHPDRILLTD